MRRGLLAAPLLALPGIAAGNDLATDQLAPPSGEPLSIDQPFESAADPLRVEQPRASAIDACDPLRGGEASPDCDERGLATPPSTLPGHAAELRDRAPPVLITDDGVYVRLSPSGDELLDPDAIARRAASPQTPAAEDFGLGGALLEEGVFGGATDEVVAPPAIGQDELLDPEAELFAPGG